MKRFAVGVSPREAALALGTGALSALSFLPGVCDSGALRNTRKFNSKPGGYVRGWRFPPQMVWSIP
jgi:hypothetical protein